MAAELVLITTDISFVFLCCEVRIAVGPLWFSVRPHWGRDSPLVNVSAGVCENFRIFFIKFAELEMLSASGLAAKMIAVDKGSIDRTKEIAITCEAKLLDFAWIDDFSATKHRSLASRLMTPSE